MLVVCPGKKRLLFCDFHPIREGTKIAKGSKEGGRERWWIGGEHLSKDGYLSQICCFQFYRFIFVPK